MRGNETLQIIKRRRSVRDYQDKQVPDADLQTIIEAALYAPNVGGNLTTDLHFTVIQNKTVLQKINTLAKEFACRTDYLKDLGGDSDFVCIYNAPTLVVVSDKEQPAAETDCAAATQNMLLAAESLGLGGCWLYFPLQAFYTPQGGELLKDFQIPHNYKPMTSLIIGYKRDETVDVPKRETRNIVYIR
jgi:nitroreductase